MVYGIPIKKFGSGVGQHAVMGHRMSAELVDLVIRGGTLVGPEESYAAGLAVTDGTIVAIDLEKYLPPARETIDASGLYVLPGVIDAHVHFRDPGIPKTKIGSPDQQPRPAAGLPPYSTCRAPIRQSTMCPIYN